MKQGLSPTPPRQQVQVYIDQDVAAYKIIEKRGFFDDQDTLWPQGSMIYWEEEPSLSFEPLNELAEITMREYLEKLDEEAKNVAKVSGKSHATLVNAFDARKRLQEMDRKMGRSVDIEEDVKIMGGRHYNKPKARSIHEVNMTPMMGHSARSSVAAKQVKGNNRKEATNDKEMD